MMGRQDRDQRQLFYEFALDTLAGVRGEMARLYRLALNGRILLRSEARDRHRSTSPGDGFLSHPGASEKFELDHFFDLN
jgi:hypothetical protein